MLTVTFPNVVESFKRAMFEALASFFDGTSHELNDLVIQFPTAKISFDIQDIDRPVGLTIVLIGETERSTGVFPCHNPVTPILEESPAHGHELRTELSRLVYIVAPDRNNILVDQAWSLLWSVFETQHANFSARNIFLPHLDLLPKETLERTDLAYAIGILMYELRVRFARYNT